MRVEPTTSELRGDEKPRENSRARGKEFRMTLRRCRRTRCGQEVVAEPPTRDLGRPAIVAHQSPGTSSGSAPPRGLERVGRAEDSATPELRIAGLTAVLASLAHGAIDVTLRTGPDGLLISLAASTAAAERMSATSGALGRRLSARNVRTRSIRVTSMSSEASSERRGDGR